MRFYAISGRAGAPAVRALTAELRRRGHEPTFDWTAHLDHACSTGTCAVDGRRGLAEVEVRAAVAADWLFVLLPMGRGAHVKLGAALGAALIWGAPRVVLVGSDDATSDRECVFYGHPRVRLARSDAELLAWVDSWGASS